MIAIVINTHKRRSFFPETLKGVLTLRSTPGPTLVYDDSAEPQVVEGVDGYAHSAWNCPGKARRAALEFALSTGAHFILALDDDLEFKPCFDQVAYNLLQSYGDRHPGCISSPYRSSVEEHLVRDVEHTNYVWGSSVSGCAFLLAKGTAESLLEKMSVAQWNLLWDWELGKFVNGSVKPKSSWVRHVGMFGVHRSHEFSGYRY